MIECFFDTQEAEESAFGDISVPAQSASSSSVLARQPSGGAGDVLPAGWLSVYDSDRGASYYINKLTGKTQWKRPTQPAQTVDSLTRSGIQSVRIDGADMVKLKTALSFVNDGSAPAAAHTARTLHKLFSSVCSVEVVEVEEDNSRSNSPFTESLKADDNERLPSAPAAESASTLPPKPLPVRKPTKVAEDISGAATEFVALRTTAQGPPEEIVVRVFKKGILLKQGKYFGSWRKLFFVLDGNSLEHYPSTQSYNSGVPATKKIILTGKGCLSYTKYSQCFTVSNGERTTWTMMAENGQEFEEWMNALRTVMGALFDDRISRVAKATSPRGSR